MLYHCYDSYSLARIAPAQAPVMNFPGICRPGVLPAVSLPSAAGAPVAVGVYAERMIPRSIGGIAIPNLINCSPPHIRTHNATAR